MIIAGSCNLTTVQLFDEHKLIQLQCSGSSDIRAIMSALSCNISTVSMTVPLENGQAAQELYVQSGSNTTWAKQQDASCVPSQKVKQRSTQGVTLLTRDTLLPLVSTMGSPCFTLTSSTYVPLLLWSSSTACGAVDESVGAASLMTQCRRLTRVSDTSTKLILGK